MVPTGSFERVRALALGVVQQAGMELVDVEIKRGPEGMMVRVYIDRQGGVSVDDCATISRRLSAALDVEDPLPVRYTLEVSSPGLDRPLVRDPDFERFAGRRIRLVALAPIEGRRNFQGRLLGLRDGRVIVALDDGPEVAIPRDQVAKARLVIEL
ncbi:MAG: ribosome maturation factor RimP [Candidatus Polarisedimenticolia bacterium]